ncbi:RepB family plasmid replication initiator protein [Oxalobacteraceae bacterium OM1]|nr:RepB family plasmid replication initiator protein [Oxalobacteraceae bacterium OM1]
MANGERVGLRISPIAGKVLTVQTFPHRYRMASKPSKKATKASELATVPSDLREFRKTNTAIGLRLVEGRLGLLSRKLYNVLLFHAQELKEPGKNAPLARGGSKEYFWVPLAAIQRDASYDSHDTKQLKETLQELQDVRVYMEDEVQWTSERLLAGVSLVNPEGLKKRGGQVWLGFAFPPEVKHLVMDPGVYTRVTLFYQSLLRSGASLALYEQCLRYATNPSRVTLKKNWEWWFGVLTGAPIDANPGEYKYFKRDVIKPAIAEINSTTDITIELIEHKAGRRVAELQFKVKPSQQLPLPMPNGPVIDTELLGRISAFGMSADEAKNLLASTEDAKLRATVGLVERRLRQSNAPKIESPAAYFKMALKNDYAGNEEVAKHTMAKAAAAKAPAEDPIDQLRSKYLVHRAKDALRLYAELDPAEQARVFGDFKSSSDAKGLKITNFGLATPSVRTAFSMWYAKQNWGDPSTDELLRYAVGTHDDGEASDTKTRRSPSQY